MTLLPGTTFLHINGALELNFNLFEWTGSCVSPDRYPVLLYFVDISTQAKLSLKKFKSTCLTFYTMTMDGKGNRERNGKRETGNGKRQNGEQASDQMYSLY